VQHKDILFDAKDFTGELFHWHYFILTGRSSSGLKRSAKMAWKTPKIVEVPVGMEINMYACAARK
jgi:coenzyme PQQ precursor peptide PqqA